MENQQANTRFIAMTECINTGTFECEQEFFETLEEAKEWCNENMSSDSYRNHNFCKIIEINNDNVENVYMRKPEYCGDWYHLW